MFFYFGLMIILASLGIVGYNKYNKVFITIFCAFVLVMILGLRAEYVGNDTLNYITSFQNIASEGFYSYENTRFEIGYQLYNYFLSLFSDNGHFLLFVTALIGISLVSVIIYKLSNNIAYSFFLFVGLRGYYFYFNDLRQSLAESIIFIAFYMLYKRKIKWFLFLVALAVMFHNTAIVFLLALAFVKFKNLKKTYFLMLIVSVIIFFNFDYILNTIIQIVPTYYSGYINSEYFKADNTGNYIDFIFKLTILGLAIVLNYGESRNSYIMGEKNKIVDNPDKLLVDMLIFSCLFALIAIKASLLERLGYYFWNFSIISISNMLYSIKNKNQRIIMYVFLTISIIIYNLGILWLRPEWYRIVPYDFFIW